MKTTKITTDIQPWKKEKRNEMKKEMKRTYQGSQHPATSENRQGTWINKNQKKEIGNREIESHRKEKQNEGNGKWGLPE